MSRLETELRRYDSMLVAFSGGADSALLLAAAADVLGPDRVGAATAYSDALPMSERQPALDFAHSLGVRVLTPQTHEMSREGYSANAGDRCFFCKTELLSVLGPLAAREGYAVVATGTNADDLAAGFRPGIRAAATLGAVTPLADAGLTKAEVRELSLQRGLPTWDKPAAACLSSRIAYGIQITSARLARVEQAEAILRTSLPGVRNLRVRDLGDHARIEVDADQLDAARAVAHLVDGWADITVEPFRSGSMNELLAQPERYR